MRISGIASGFDTDALVKSMMAVERMKVDRVAKSRQTVLWRQESYNTMNKAFANFILNTQKDMGLKKTSSTGSISNSSYKNVDYVKKATSSNEAAATVTSSSSAVNGSYKIDVEQLAEGASFDAELKQVDIEGKTSLSFKINGLEINVGNGSKQITMDDIVKEINNSKTTMLDGRVVIGDTFADDGELLKDPQKKLVKEGSLGVSAFYDKVNERLFIQTKETGEKAKIKVENSLFDGEKEGQNAIIKFNDVELKYTSNNVNINGLDIELKGVTTIKDKLDPSKITLNPISINVSTNTQGIMEKVEKLVKDYNDLIDLASKSLSEKSYAGYQPLTSEERKAMSEDDVKLWDEKAKSGLLNRDETITRTLQAIRNDLYKTVEGLDEEFNHITKIGITTESYARGSAGGKLQINKEKLQEAIEKNPDAVMDLLFTEGKNVVDDPDGTKPANGTTTKGIFSNIYANLITGMKAIVDKSGPGQDSDLLRGVNSSMLIDFVTKKSSISDLDKAVQDMNKQMDSLNVLLGKKEDSYYAKFTAMEKNMHKMNGQSGWLQQQFG